MENDSLFTEYVDLSAPLLQPDTIITMDDSDNIIDDTNIFDEKKFANDLYQEIMANNDNPLIITKKMILFDTFSFLVEGIYRGEDYNEIFYWMPEKHPIADFLKIYEIKPIEIVDKGTFGLSVIHQGCSVEMFVDKMRDFFKSITHK